MIYIRSFLFQFCFFLWTAIFSVSMMWTFLIPRKAVVWIVTWFFRSYIPLERFFVGLDYKVEGWENMPKGPCIIALKHQSLYETVMLHHLFGDVAIILKKELMRVPFWGWYQWKSGVIPVDRNAGGGAMASLIKGAEKVLKEGRNIAIFPQGTRVPVGKKAPYRMGAAVLAEHFNLPVVPVALNSGLFWPKRSFVIKPGVVTFRIFPAIPAGLTRDQTQKEIERIIETESDRLVAEFKQSA